LVRAFIVLSLCFGLAACATVEPVPVARPLSQANIEALGPTRTSLTGDQGGVGKSWYYTEVNGGGAGLAGVLAGVIVGAIVNTAPSHRASRQATEIAEVVTPERLNESLAAKFKALAEAPHDRTVTFSDVVVTQKVVTPGELDDTLEIATSYTLSEDSSVLRMVSTATYKNAAIPYKTRYTFKKQAPASENTGPLYRNVFTYYSTPLPVPVLTPELKERLAASVRDSMRNESGALPAEGTGEYKSMLHEVELAQDDKLTGGETSVFLTREWLKNHGEPLKQEIEKAHAFIAKYVLLDINRTAIPSLEGTDELLETTSDDRTVRRIGAGAQAGSYVSSAANVVTPATYGNAVAVGKATENYVSGLKHQVKKDK
jgi:hypothetical protein